MMNLDQMAHQIPPVEQTIVDFLQSLKAAGEPITISINGRGQLPIRDDGAFQLLLNLLDRLELTEVLGERLADLNAGKPTLSMEEAKEMVRTRYGISV